MVTQILHSFFLDSFFYLFYTRIYLDLTDLSKNSLLTCWCTRLFYYDKKHRFSDLSGFCTVLS